MNSKQLISRNLLIAAGLLALVLLVGFNLAFGSVNIPLTDVLKTFAGRHSDNIVFQNILLRTRLPQTLVALSAGMALGVAGLLMQTLFRNPLAGPSVLGISSGASLGVAFVLLVAGQVFGFSMARLGVWGDLAVIFASLGGALLILLLIVAIARKVGGTLSVLILGVMIGYLSNSLVSVLKFYSLEEDVHSYVIWGLGSFGRLSTDRSLLFAGLTIPLSLLALFLSKQLNLLALGDYYAKNLGLNIGRSRLLIILTSGILTAVVTAFCGPIIFIGMAVPHLAKMLARTSNHFILLVYVLIFGAVTSLLCNLIARLPGLEGELPINSVTAFVGAPVVISVILKRRLDRATD